MTSGNGDLTYPPCVVCKKPVIFSIPHVTWQIRRGFAKTHSETFEVSDVEVVAVFHLECAYGPAAVLKAMIEQVWQETL